MKILVTGSNGMIGRALVKELRKKGHYAREFSKSNRQNILDKAQVEESLKEMQVVYHLAAEIDENSPTIFETNVQGTKNLVEASARAKIEQFIFVSTTGVYGKNENLMDEKTALNPETIYEKSKAEAEKIVSSYQEAMPITILRPPLVLGNNAHWKKMLEMLEKNYPLIGNGNNFYQIVFLQDLIDAMAFVLGKKDTIGETFVVAQDDALTFRQICGEIQKNAGIKNKIWSIPLWVGKMALSLNAIALKLLGKNALILPAHAERICRNRKYNISKIKALGWKPKYSTKEAIAITVKEIIAEKEISKKQASEPQNNKLK